MYQAVHILCAAALQLVINVHSFAAFFFSYCILILSYRAVYSLPEISSLFT